MLVNTLECRELYVRLCVRQAYICAALVFLCVSPNHDSVYSDVLHKSLPLWKCLCCSLYDVFDGGISIVAERTSLCYGHDFLGHMLNVSP